METTGLLEISQEAIFVLLKVSAPILLVTLAVGLIISLFQALTQIQESTLSFVPKILVVCLSLILFMPFMLSSLKLLFEHIANYIIAPI